MRQHTLHNLAAVETAFFAIDAYQQMLQYAAMMDKSPEILSVLERCGGAVAIWRASQDTRNPIGNYRTPYKWARLGVPERHWALIRELSGVGPDELHNMNERIRAQQGGETCAA